MTKDMKDLVHEGEQIDEINEKLSLIQKKDGLRFSTDAYLLAAFAKRYFQREMDAGTPFTNAGADEIFRLGILTIVLPLAARLLSEITNGVLREAMDGAGKLAVDNGGAVGMGIAFLVMSVIFRYGAQLEEKTK